MADDTTWILVADEAIARILSRPDDGGDLQPVEELTDPAAHADNADLRRDAYGRRGGRAAYGGQPNTAPRAGGPSTATASAGEEQTHLEATAFARRVAAHLAQALQQRRFGHLHIAAAPRFLGLLRKALSAQVSATVRSEVDKDVIHETERELTQRLFPA